MTASPSAAPAATSAAPDFRSVLQRTFVHLTGIGEKTERHLWAGGIDSWNALAATSFALRPEVRETLTRSAVALAEADVEFFFTALPTRERWRTFAEFGDRFAAVDIETTGMSTVYDEVTVIGVESGGVYRPYVAGGDLDEAREAIERAAGLITFNGARFDLPFLKKALPGVRLPAAHVDLRFLSRRVGLSGSLKAVERAARMRRTRALKDIAGYEATVLWARFQAGDSDALARLVLYNAADTCVLRPLAELVVERLHDQLADLGHDALVGSLLAEALPATASATPRGRGRPMAPLPTVRREGEILRVGDHAMTVPATSGLRPLVTLADLRARMPDPDARIVGIDLTGSERRPTGWALLEGAFVVTGSVTTTAEIVERTAAARPAVVSIDSPLSLPVGRHCTDDDCWCRAVGGITRACERELKRRGVNVYPCLLPSMQALTLRGQEIAEQLRGRGIAVIESYPGAAQDIMRIPRKGAGERWLRAGLERFGLRGLRRAGALTHDELDAATSAAVGSFWLAGLFEALGNDDEDFLVIPDLAELTGNRAPASSRLTPADAPALVALVGANADLLAARLRLNTASRHEDAGPGRPLLCDDPDAYVQALCTLGPRLRGVGVLPPGGRLARRPDLVDAEVAVDHPRPRRALRQFAV